MDFEFINTNINTGYFRNIFDYPESKNLNENDMKEMLKNKKGPFYKSIDGAIFDFNINNNLLEGNGIIIFPEGCFYDGTLSNGIPDGYGKFVNSLGSSYIGEWNKGVREGWGVFDDTIINYRYNGNWMNNKKHGIGNENINNESFDIIYDNDTEISRINHISRKMQDEIGKILKKNKILENKINNYEKKNGSINKITKEKDIKISKLNQNLKELEKNLKDLEFSKQKNDSLTKKLKEENMLVRKENVKLLSKGIKIKKEESQDLLKLKQENKKIYLEKQDLIGMYKGLFNYFDESKLSDLQSIHENLIKEIKETQSINTRYKLEKNVAILKLKKLEEDHKNIKKNYNDLLDKISCLERTLENDKYLGQLFFNIEDDIRKLNTEYEDKLNMLKNLNFSEEEKLYLENKINELQDLLNIKKLDIKNFYDNELLLKETINKINEDNINKDLKIKKLSDSSNNNPEQINLLKKKIEKEMENSLEKDILLDTITNENNAQSSTIKSLETRITNLECEYQCKICMSKNSNIIVMPCGHLAMCNTCEIRCRRQTNQRCPMCRKVYHELIRIYT